MSSDEIDDNDVSEEKTMQYIYVAKKEMDLFIKSLSHKITSHIRSIQSGIEFLKQKDISREKHEEILELMSYSSTELNNIFHDIDDRYKKEIKDINLKKVIETASKLSMFQNPNKNIIIDSNLDEQIEFTGVENEFFTVFFNIINNSFEAIGEEDGEIIIKLSMENQFINFVCQDNGGGIEDSLLELIPNPNFSTKEYHKGMGLYISKAIIESYNGILSINSKSPNTIVSINFPIKNDI